jgi:hypothetical protein
MRGPSGHTRPARVPESLRIALEPYATAAGAVLSGLGASGSVT